MPTTKGEWDMQILKIDDGKGYFYNLKSKNWDQIDTIDKSSLLDLLNYFVSNEIKLDSTDKQLIQNQAQQIIYKSISEKFGELLDAKSKFKDEADRMYLDQIKRYQQ